jgi:hypothetical protein
MFVTRPLDPNFLFPTFTGFAVARAFVSGDEAVRAAR